MLLSDLDIKFDYMFYAGNLGKATICSHADWKTTLLDLEMKFNYMFFAIRKMARRHSPTVSKIFLYDSEVITSWGFKCSVLFWRILKTGKINWWHMLANLNDLTERTPKKQFTQFRWLLDQWQMLTEI